MMLWMLVCSWLNFVLSIIFRIKKLQCLFFISFLYSQAKALAEKNERDMQQQREQAERHVSTLL